MLRLDAPVLLTANEAKAWGTSIYSYVEASQHASLLIALCWACILPIQFATWLGGYSLHGFGDPAVRYAVATVTIEV